MQNILSSGAALLALALLVAPPALADTLVTTAGDKVHETSHEVRLSVEDGTVRYLVTRAFRTSGLRAGEALLTLDLPPDAVAVGLRLKSRGAWSSALLSEEGGPRNPLLAALRPPSVADRAELRWSEAGRLALHLLIESPGAEVEVEYTLVAPSVHQQGREWSYYPARDPASHLATPSLTLDAAPGTRFRVDQQDAPLGAPVRLSYSPAPQCRHELMLSTHEELKSAAVTIDLDHPAPQDLLISLTSPAGETFWLHNQDATLAPSFSIEELTGALPGAWQLEIEDVSSLDEGVLRGWSLAVNPVRGKGVTRRAAGLSLPIPDAGRPAPASPLRDLAFHTLEVTLPAPAPVQAQLADLSLPSGDGATLLRLDAAEALRPVPRGLGVVFVLDASYSNQDHLETELALVDAFLHHVPDATAEVVLYRRRAAPLFGALLPAKEVPRALEEARRADLLTPGNGSHLDEGLRAAAQALSTHPGPSMIVTFTDGTVRSRLRPEDARAALAPAPSARVHLLYHVAGAGPALSRADGFPFASLATQTGGMPWKTSITHEWSKPSELRDLMRGAVSPVQLEELTLEGLSPDQRAALLPITTLAAGAGHYALVRLPSPRPRSLTLRGKLWQEDWSLPIEADPRAPHPALAFLFSTDLFYLFSNDDQLAAAKDAKAVSPLTSYVAIAPNEWTLPYGSHCCSASHGLGYGSVSGRGKEAPPAPADDLAALLAPGAAQCAALYPAPTGWSLTLQVQTHRDEVLDVYPSQHGPTADARASCLEEAVWALRLHQGFAIHESNSYSLSF